MSKKLIAYILISAFLFALLDWKTVQYTRLKNREWLDWMHAHERQYATVVRAVEAILCAPAIALKPIFYYALMSVEAAQEEQDAINHAPKPTWQGFYHLTDRRYSWTFVSWFSWFTYWLGWSAIWFAARGLLLRWLRRAK